MDQLTFEIGNNDCLSFILDAIIESEKSNSTNISYCTLFDISETEFREILKLIFQEDISNIPWCFSNWIIGSFESKPVTGLAYWLEKSDLSSELIKLQALNYHLKSKVEKSTFSFLLQKLQRVSIPRIPHFWQMEHMYTLSEYRGSGHIKNLIEFVLTRSNIKKSQIQLTANNHGALKAYLSLGFKVSDTKCEEGLAQLKLLANDCKLNLVLDNE